ncbi:MAG: hypothetical protein RMK19_00845 [Bacteroidia bacterium]|nr:hypothetical protein [Bacteroidia bacterium]MDW8014540.1 hypothetical protein [Bacteroidia bacterium]
MRKLLIITGLSSLGLIGCGRRAAAFLTPHDKELLRALRQQGKGWVRASFSPDTSPLPSSRVLLPGQFIRLVMELPYMSSEDISTQSQQVLRVDTLRIFEDSLVHTPWGGALRIGGLTVDSARVLLQNAAERIFLGVRLYLYPLYAYYLFGQVTQQGRILFDRAQIPLSELLAFMMLPTREADLSRVKVLRGPPYYKEVFLVDARSAEVLTGGFLLQAEDIILVESRAIIRQRIELQNLIAFMGVLQVVNLLFVIFQVF